MKLSYLYSSTHFSMDRRADGPTFIPFDKTNWPLRHFRVVKIFVMILFLSTICGRPYAHQRRTDSRCTGQSDIGVRSYEPLASKY